MAKALTALWHGGNYQARVFWENALDLLRDHSCVVEVTFEADEPKSFDDVVVRYDPPIVRSGTNRINAEYHQVKWHASADSRFGYEDFVHPKFIGATSISLLERLKNARERLPNPEAAQFTFLTTAMVKDADPLGGLISNVDRTLILERLFDGKTDRSRMGKIRRLWRDHLGLSSDDELMVVLGGFRIIQGRRTLDDLRRQISFKAEAMGIKGVSASTSDFRYDSLAQQLKIRNLNALTRKTLIQFLNDEGLPMEKNKTTDPFLPVAIRSFIGPAADVSDAMPDNTLLLSNQFKQRYLQEGQDWQRNILPQVEDFLCEVVRKSSQIRLILDAHASVAFLSGTVFNVKSAVELQLVQKGRVGAKIWCADDGTEDSTVRFSVTQDELDSRKDIAVAISVAQPVESDVRKYIAKQLSDTGQLLTFAFPDGTGHQKVVGGGHAVALAEQIAKTIRQIKQGDSDAMTHIFAAVPNSLMFYLGQNHQSIAPCTIYEFDFDRKGNKTYQPSFVFD